MCNINIIKSITNRKSARLTECMNVVSFNSFLSNKDSEGFYCEDFKVKRSLDKQVMKGEHSLIVSHQRISTSGKNAEMTQPLESKNFILTHNGVMRTLNGISIGNVKESDTYEYLQKFEEYYALSGDTIKTIQQICKETTGSYSIVLFNKKTKEFYYYKNYITNMYIAKSKSYLMLSTKEENVEYMQKYFGGESEREAVKHEVIYDLNRNFEAVAEFNIYEPPKVETQKQLPSSDGWGEPSRGRRDGIRGHRSISTADSDRIRIKKALEGSGFTGVRCGIHNGYANIGVDISKADSFEAIFAQDFVRLNPKYGRARYELPLTVIMQYSDSFHQAGLSCLENFI